MLYKLEGWLYCSIASENWQVNVDVSIFSTLVGITKSW